MATSVASLSLALFLEDIGQMRFVNSLIKRVATEHSPPLDVEAVTRNATGGKARVVAELRRYLRDLILGEDVPDILVIAVDCDCQSRTRLARALTQLVNEASVASCLVLGLPEPHVERWYLADQAAIQRVTRAPGMPALPPPRCRKDLFKRALSDAFAAGGLYPPLGGIEYAEEIVREMDLAVAAASDSSLNAFVGGLRSCFQRSLAQQESP
ncbi:MAG: hypothetical protein HYY03_07185 [Chloroflexi bacterium]|nr:hypothetical protein [Chloroflexota bacterium]